MSVTTNLPPEAYTREVLVKAYDWLSTQSSSVKSRATSADSLVALYLQAKRRNFSEHGSTTAYEPPTAASVEAFKEDLRNLAEGLRQFDDPLAPPPQPVIATQPASEASRLAGFVADWAPQPQSPPPPAAPAPSMHPVTMASNLPLDAKSREWVQEVQRRLNLTSESEALRALLAVGYERLRDILPQA